MANGHGGSRTPAHPAATSGPGKYSRRTDGRQPIRDLPNAEYGGNADFREMQSAGQMAASGERVEASAQRPVVQMPQQLTEPGDPNQPVTAGADAGEGPGSSVLNLPPDAGSVEQLRQQYGQYIPVLVRMADSPMSSPQLRDQVRYLLSIM